MLYSAKDILDAERIVKLCGGIRSRNGLVKKLKANGFKILTDIGSFKIVYYSKAFPSFVVKVFRSSKTVDQDSCIAALKGNAIKFYIEPVIDNDFMMIQKRANRRGGTSAVAASRIRRVLKDNTPADMHANNAAFHNGKPYFLILFKAFKAYETSKH